MKAPITQRFLVGWITVFHKYLMSLPIDTLALLNFGQSIGLALANRNTSRGSMHAASGGSFGELEQDSNEYSLLPASAVTETCAEMRPLSAQVSDSQP